MLRVLTSATFLDRTSYGKRKRLLHVHKERTPYLLIWVPEAASRAGNWLIPILISVNYTCREEKESYEGGISGISNFTERSSLSMFKEFKGDIQKMSFLESWSPPLVCGPEVPRATTWHRNWYQGRKLGKFQLGNDPLYGPNSGVPCIERADIPTFPTFPRPLTSFNSGHSASHNFVVATQQDGGAASCQWGGVPVGTSWKTKHTLSTAF